MKKVLLRTSSPAVCLMFLLSLLLTAHVYGQNRLDPSFAAGVTNGLSDNYVSALQADGKVLVGGNFNITNGSPRNFLSRINANGTVDTSFNPGGTGPSADVVSILTLSDGKILIGGSFNIYNNAPAVKLARLNADGTLDATFNVGGSGVTAGRITSMVQQADGKFIIVGQGLSAYNGVSAFGIFRINADGSRDASFVTGFNAIPGIEEVALQPDQKIILTGGFTGYNGAVRAGVIRILTTGAIDPTFNAGGAGTTGAVSGVALQPDGKVIIGGDFTAYNGTTLGPITRLNADGTPDAGFVPPARGTFDYVESIAVQADGKILAAGAFGYSGGQVRPLIRLEANGTADAAYLPLTTDSLAYNVTLQPDGQAILTGYFSRFSNGTLRSGVARIKVDGTIDSTFEPSLTVNGLAQVLVQQPDGKIVTAGNFQTANGLLRKGIVRFNVDGSVDNTFTSEIGQSSSQLFLRDVLSLTMQPDGKILVGGAFGSFGGSGKHGIVRLNADGTLDNSFVIDNGFNFVQQFWVYAMRVQPDGKILCGGQAVTPTSQLTTLWRLNADGSLDGTFDRSVSANSTVLSITLLDDGKIIATGNFSTYGGLSRQRIARVNSNGTLDATFNPGTAANGLITDLLAQPDGKFIIGGSFTTYAGVNRARVARLNPNGTLDTTFNPGAGANGTVRSIALLPSGKIMLGGSFTLYDGVQSVGLARLNADGTRDMTFTSGFANDGSAVFQVRTQINGSLVASGAFSSYGGVSRKNILRLTSNAPFDYDGDGKADLSVFRPSTFNWYSLGTTSGFVVRQFGDAADKIVPADYDGDGKTDIAVFRPSNGMWYRINSATNTFAVSSFGTNGDLPMPGDFDADGKADLAVFRPSNGTWYRSNSGLSTYVVTQFGTSEDKPVMGDFDADGRADLAVFRPSNGTWYMQKSSGSYAVKQFGQNGDVSVPADYDGDGTTDLAVYRPSTGNWYVLKSSGTYFVDTWGESGDIPAPADFDGDGKADLNIFRPSTGTWFRMNSSGGIATQSFGISGDIPTPNAFIY